MRNLPISDRIYYKFLVSPSGMVQTHRIKAKLEFAKR